MSTRTFPGVYTTVRDDSFFTTISSRFRGGLVGTAEKGPFNVAIQVKSIRDFQTKFGKSLQGGYLANAVQLTSDISDGLVVVRVGRQYEAASLANASGAAGTNVIYTPNSNLLAVDDYVRISQTGKATTVNARVASVAAGSVTLVTGTSEEVLLADNYTAAIIDKAAGSYALDPSERSGAANEAEAFLSAPSWGSVLSAVGNVIGTKNAYQFEITGDPTGLSVGDQLLITQTGKKSTREVQISRIIPASGGANAVIQLEPVNRVDSGYRALPLQDSYTTGSLQVKQAGLTTVAHLLASEAGTWANVVGRSTGLVVRIFPGSAADSKRLAVYLNSALVENFDNLSFDPTSSNYYETAINGKSAYIQIKMLANSHPATTLEASTGLAISNLASFSGGFNGESATAPDYIGTIDPATQTATGLKLFEDIDSSIKVSFLACPGVTDLSVAAEMGRICRQINAEYVFDIPDFLNAFQAVDWHNGAGLYSGVGSLDDNYGALFWNWFEITDAWTGKSKFVPPTVGALRALAFTFDSARPWSAACGEVRGVLPEAKSVRYPKLTDDARQLLQGNGNVINPIMFNRNRIMVFGDRTTQRVDSKLTALHSNVLVNYIMTGLSDISRRFVFEAIDDVLLAQINLACKAFLDSVKNDRGMEQYELRIDATNNTAATRNARNVIVDLFIVPIDVAERIFINATVRESGAVLNNAA